jgi:Ca2+-transporting ATPase
LWINLVTNGLPALALGVDSRDPEQMKMSPRAPGGAILTGSEYVQMAGIGAVMAVTAIIAFLHYMPNPHHAADPEQLAHARAIVFCILSVGPLAHSFNCRSERRSLFSIGVFSNRALWGAVVTGVILQAGAIYVPQLRPLFKTAPLGGMDLVWVFGMGLVPFIGGELAKLALALRPR